MKEENEKPIELVMEQIKERFGEGVIMKLGEVKKSRRGIHSDRVRFLWISLSASEAYPVEASH